MSYGFDMSFKPANSWSEALEIGAAVAEEMAKPGNIKKLLQSNTFYIPSNRYGSRSDTNAVDESLNKLLDVVKEETPKIDTVIWETLVSELTICKQKSQQTQEFSQHLIHLLDQNWLQNLLTLNFVYWDKQKVVGIVGDTWPVISEDTGWTSVYFQNSGEQDYSFETWKGIPLFQQQIEMVKSMSIKDLLEKRKDDDEDFDGKMEDRLKSDPQYLLFLQEIQTYQQIYEGMDFTNWLYDRNSNMFKRFSFSVIHSYYQKLDLWDTFLKNRKVCAK